MKFDCGPTEEEKLEEEFKKLEQRAAEIMQWHKWFAWYPVRVDSHDCRWLEYVERRTIKRYNYNRCGDWWFSAVKTAKQPIWEYRAINLNND